MTPGGIVALCASAVTICGGLAHLVRMAYRLVRTLTVTVDAVAELTGVITHHLHRHEEDADKVGVDRKDFDALVNLVHQLQHDVRDLQTMFRPAFRHRGVPDQTPRTVPVREDDLSHGD